MVWSKLKSPFTRTGRREKKLVDCLVDKQSINEEYMEVHRTKSYMEMLNKVEGQLGRKSLDRLSSSSSLPLRLRLSEYVLEPRQETLIDMIKNSNLHCLLANYFEASFEACNKCELLLRGVHQARSNYRIIKRVIKQTKKSQSHDVLFEELASFSVLENPMLIISPSQFRDLHDSHGFLLHSLTMKFRKVKRRLKLNKLCKKIAGFGLLVSYSALLISLLVLMVHSMVGIVATPCLIVCSLSLVIKIKRNKLVHRWLRTSFLERLGSQLEVAAKGVFILINDFDTMSRLVRRLQDEIEHSKAIADMCVKNGKSEVLMEVVREFQIHQTYFLDQLEELEQHIYLCFLTINRSRMLVMQEIMGLQPENR